MPALANDDVIVHGNAERPRHGDDRAGHLDVGARGRGVAGAVVPPLVSADVVPEGLDHQRRAQSETTTSRGLEARSER
jgi:hypothetical protein